MDLTTSVAPWPGVIRPCAVPGLATCLQEGRLCADGRPLRLSELEVEALSLAEWAVARHRPLVLCPADPLAPLCDLIAATVHVADMTAQYGATHMAKGSRHRVAVVSSDYRTRGLYRRLAVSPGRGLGSAPLRDVVPAATLGRDGIVRVLGSDLGRGWSTVFVTSVRDLGSVGKVDLVIIELPSPGAEELLERPIPVVLVARDPGDPLLVRVGSKALIFGWGPGDIARLGDGFALPPRLACRAAGSECEVIAVKAHAVCENAALFWQDIGPLVRSGGRSFIARDLSRQAFSLFHDLLGLAVPLDVYEAVAVPVRARLEAVGAAARLTRGETRDLYLPMVEAELRDLAAALHADPPKHDALLQALGQLLDDHRDVMLVVRTAELARMYASHLADNRALGRVRVMSLGALADPDLVPADAALLTGMAPSWARWVYRAGIARTLRILAYAPAGEVESVAAGFSEVDLVRRVVAEQTANECRIASPVMKDRTWSELSGEPRLVAGDPETTMATVDGVPVIEMPPADVPPGLWDDRGWIAPLEPGVAGAGPTADTGPRAHSPDEPVNAVRVTFNDGRWALMDTASFVTRFRPGSGRPDAAYPVADLKPGDHVVFFDRDSRKDLLAKVLEVAGEVPALAVAAAWLAHWRRVLVAGYRRFGSYPAFASALREQGCTVQAQTVRLWVVGVTIGPEDGADVRRVGLVTEDAVLQRGHAEVHRAMRSLRGAHVQLGRRLSEVARHVGSAAASGALARDEVVDELTGLTAADFHDSLDILTVRTVEAAGDVPYAVVGRLNDASEEGF